MAQKDSENIENAGRASDYIDGVLQLTLATLFNNNYLKEKKRKKRITVQDAILRPKYTVFGRQTSDDRTP